MKQKVVMLAACLFSSAVYAGDGEFMLGLGGFDVDNSATSYGQVQYRYATDWSGFRPQMGVFVTADSAAYLYGGIAYPVSFNADWSLEPSISAGYYHDGDDKDLGYDLEFYTQLRLNYSISSEAKIGLGIGHISNANLGDDNPGANTAIISYSFSY